VLVELPLHARSPNEHLYYETPYYNYARSSTTTPANAPAVRQGAGSAIFLHVTDGYATAGCVAISQSKLVTLLRWLRPARTRAFLIACNMSGSARHASTTRRTGPQRP